MKILKLKVVKEGTDRIIKRLIKTSKGYSVTAESFERGIICGINTTNYATARAIFPVI